MPDWENHVDRIIREAMQSGAFENLPGEGKPLDLGDETTPEHLRMAYKILKDNDLAPDWILEGKELEVRLAGWYKALRSAARAYREGERDPLRRLSAESDWRLARRKLTEQARELNRAITRFNLKLPPGIGHRPLIAIEREFERMA